MKFRRKNHKHLTVDEIERRQMDKDPLDKLHRHQTEILDNYYSMSPEDDSSIKKDPEIIAIESFLAHA